MTVINSRLTAALFIMLLNCQIFSEQLDGMWKFSGSVETKNIEVPAVNGFPSEKVPMQRVVAEDADGDVVFGIWRQDSSSSQNPTVSNNSLVFSGGQTAYIEGVAANITALRKLSLEFKPADMSSDVNLIDIPYAVQVRLEPGVNNTARIRFYVTNDASPSELRNAKSGYTVKLNEWNRLECVISDGNISVTLNGVKDPAVGTVSLEGTPRAASYPNVFLGSRWDGATRWYNGALDNIKFTYYGGENCGDFGFFKADVNKDCYVDNKDAAKIAEDYKGCTDPKNEGCKPLWEVLDGDEALEARRTRLIAAAIGLEGTYEGREPIAPNTEVMVNIFGAYSSTLLRLGLQKEKCNETIRYICNNLEKPRGKLDYAVNEENFTALELVRVYVALKDSELLEESTRTAIEDAFKTYDFEPGETTRSENHYLIFWTSRYLMAQEMPDETFSAYGKTGAQLYIEDGQRLRQFMRYRARQGWGEFDSDAYQFLSMNTILTLYDLAEDQEIVEMAGKTVNLMLADSAVDTIGGMFAGPRGRVPEESTLDSGASGGVPPMNNMNEIFYLYFGIDDPDPTSGKERFLRLKSMNFWDRSNESLFSSFKPMGIVNDIMLDRSEQYVNRERKHLHNMADPLPESPLEGTISKYTLYVPDKYALGCLQLQDPYPADLEEGIYAKHQQLEWMFTVPSGTKTRIFTHHPGNTGAHKYWVGDLGCDCVDTFQNKTAVLALYDIGADQPYQYIHAYLPRNEFDQIVEDSGWIFGRKSDVYFGIFFTGGYRWTTDGKWTGVEVISDGAKKAAVFEAGLEADFGSFEGFMNEIKTNTVLFNQNTMTLAYNSKKAGMLKINSANLRQLNGSDVDLDYKTYDSPYMQSQWDSGIITLKHGEDEVVLDFN